MISVDKFELLVSPFWGRARILSVNPKPFGFSKFEKSKRNSIIPRDPTLQDRELCKQQLMISPFTQALHLPSGSLLQCRGLCPRGEDCAIAWTSMGSK